MSKNNRRKGHVYERYLAKLFRVLGYENVKPQGKHLGCITTVGMTFGVYLS